MKDIIVFVVGITIGAVVALLLAPERGEDLRMQLHERAGQDMQRLQTAYQIEFGMERDQPCSRHGQFQDMQKQVSDWREKSPEESQS